MDSEGVGELLWIHYKSGARAMSQGWAFEPPDNILLRQAYVEGWQDMINNRYPTKEEFLSTFTQHESQDSRKDVGPVVREDTK